ncbi:class D beta-lactamase [uncultured Massilia sp.]|uniref:class D beta-lactamase n=1 Tax=uncultured Massilia sp. TaxID=169973 RepID=UPI0025F657D3|nr:class D beta-lactamase [uncultured Massilia sp.]
MSALDIVLARFLLASAGCLGAGLCVWGLAALLRRRLPALAIQRTTWLLAQLTVAAAFAVVLLPHGGRLQVVPVIEMEAIVPPPQEGARAAPAAAPASAAAPAARAHESSWLAWTARAWAACYLAGLAWMLLRLLRARRVLDALAAHGRRLPGGARPVVIEVDAPISPMLLGPARARLLLPRHLRDFDALQREMIVEHELTHWRRRDLYWMAAGLALQLAFWFNPFMRLLRERLSWAQELGCDRDVLRGRPPAQRKAYAAALLAQLRLQHRPIGATLAFGAVRTDTLAVRIALIREPIKGGAGRRARVLAVAGLAAVFLANLAFQPALAWQAGVPVDAWPAPRLSEPGLSAAAAPLACTEIADAAGGAALVRDGRCAERVTPASTYKIPLVLMGFDSGLLRDEHAPRLPFKPGYADWQPSWRADTDPAGWIRNSTVWYSQQVATRLGAARVQDYLDRFGYGNRDLSGAPGDPALALSELSPTLKISADEQVAFLRKVATRSLPLSRHAYETSARLLQVRTLGNGWRIHGKTGTAMARRADGSEQAGQMLGWFVGWASKDGRTLVFARLEQQAQQDGTYAGARVRDAMLRELEQRLPTL